MCWSYINDYYEAIVCAINNAVDDCVPLLRPGSLKSFWSTELQELKQASIDAYKLWKLCDRPRDGLVNRLRLESKYKYKLAIKRAELQRDLEFDDELSNYYMQKDTNNFWKAWNHRFSRRSLSPSNINGCCKNDEIVEIFRNSFSYVQFDSYLKSNQVADCLQNLKSLSAAESTENFNECDVLFDVEDIEKGLNSLKFNKAGGVDGLTKECISYCHPSVFIHLKFLFNMICMHGFVPDVFGVGIVIPVVKDRLGDICSANNYRPITLSPVISKIFECCLLHKYEHFLYSDELQFGFKKNSSCSHALFVLSQVVNYFSSHGSTVYMASLDASKAFDRVNHIKLFEKLIARGLPSYIIKVLIDWYGKIFSVVRWKNCFSLMFSVRSGIRQGGILSPFLFNIYADSLITIMRSSDLGCHIGECYVGCIAYADDLILLSGSLTQLQKMLQLCEKQAQELDLMFNSKKSCLFKVGVSSKETLDNLKLNGCDVYWVDKLRYLGVFIVEEFLR